MLVGLLRVCCVMVLLLILYCWYWGGRGRLECFVFGLLYGVKRLVFYVVACFVGVLVVY